jgi:hypothetical protein
MALRFAARSVGVPKAQGRIVVTIRSARALTSCGPHATVYPGPHEWTHGQQTERRSHDRDDLRAMPESGGTRGARIRRTREHGRQGRGHHIPGQRAELTAVIEPSRPGTYDELLTDENPEIGRRCDRATHVGDGSQNCGYLGHWPV